MTTLGMRGHFAPPKRTGHKPATSLTKISEAAEWAEESSQHTASQQLDEELEAVWAEAGVSAADERKGSTSASSSGEPKRGAASSTAAAAVAAASAARKAAAGTGISSSLTSKRHEKSTIEANHPLGLSAGGPVTSTLSSERAESSSLAKADSSDDEFIDSTAVRQEAKAASSDSDESSEPETSDDEEDGEAGPAKLVVLSMPSDQSSADSAPQSSRNSSLESSMGMPAVQKSECPNSSAHSQKPGLLEAIGSAVESVERPSQSKPEITVQLEPSSGSVGKPSGAMLASSKPKPMDFATRIAGRVDNAVRKKAALAKSNSSAAAKSVTSKQAGEETQSGMKPLGGLQGLRKAYQEPQARQNIEVRLEQADDEAAVEQEWANIAEKTEELAALAQANAGKLGVVPQTDILGKPITYAEVHDWIMNVEVDGRTGPVTDVPDLEAHLRSHLDRFLWLKQTDFDFNEQTHHRMLRTIYSKLARAKVCPSIGSHWEVLGFQSGDPRTDLNRSGGVLNVVQLFFMFAHYYDLFKAAYRLSQDYEQQFPLACVSINITRMVLDCLLSGRLSELCNSNDKGVLDTACHVHSGGLYHFYYRWRTQKRTIRDTELTFNEIRELMMDNPSQLVEGIVQGVVDLRAKSDSSRLEFTDLDFGGSRSAQPASEESSMPDRLRNYLDSSAEQPSKEPA